MEETTGTGIPNFTLRSNGVYYVRKQVGGEEKWISTRKRDRKAALIVYNRLMNDLNENGTVGQTPLFKDWWEDYRENVTLQEKTSSRNDDQMIKHVISGWESPEQREAREAKGLKVVPQVTIQDSWGNRRVDSINEMAIKRYLTRRRKEGAAEGTLTKELGFLQAIFERAVKNKLIRDNPFKDIAREGYEIRERVLTHEEQEKLLAAFEPYSYQQKNGTLMPFPGNKGFQRFILFILGTGLRLEEVRTIDPKKDVHLEQRFVTVTRKTKGRKKKIQEIPLFDDDVVDVLREQLAEEGKLWTVTQPGLRTMLRRGCIRAGIAHIWPHALRHTFATRFLQQAPEKIYTLSLILGHSSVTITERIYAHLLKEDLLKASQGISMGLKPAKVVPFAKEA